MATICIFFSLDMHHLLIQGIADSYSLFLPGVFPQVEDMMVTIGRTVATTFAVALAFASPHLIIGLLVNLSGGLMSRVMPAMQVFFIIMPVQIAATVFLLVISLSAGMMMYLEYMEGSLTAFLRP
jgi:flagellar biosynthetic protein FliR